MNIIEALNIAHGLSNMNLGSIIDRSSTSKTGMWYFFSNYVAGLNRAPEYMTRLGIFIAELIKDDAWKAYSFTEKDGLKYDWKKDGRFAAYASKNTNDANYATQRGLYLTLLQEFNKENVGSNLKEGDDLPAAYTNRQVESLKSYSDSILGYYDPQVKLQWQSTLWGANFMHFKTWMVAAKDKWYLKGQV